MDDEQIVLKISKAESGFQCTLSFCGDDNDICNLIKTIQKLERALQEQLISKHKANPEVKSMIQNEFGVTPIELDKLLNTASNLPRETQMQILRDFIGLLKGK